MTWAREPAPRQPLSLWTTDRSAVHHWVAGGFGGLDKLALRVDQPRHPAVDEVTIRVHAAGMNPVDYLRMSYEPKQNPAQLPLQIGYEVAGTIIDVGTEAVTGSGRARIGQNVLAFRIEGGYATTVTVPAKDVFLMPQNLTYPEAANLLFAGTAAAELLHLTRVGFGDTILVHGASGAVGTSLVQQALLLGCHVIGTASSKHFSNVARFGGVPIRYGPGLEDRVRAAAPNGVTAALDTSGTAEATTVSLALVTDKSKIITTAAFELAAESGTRSLGFSPASDDYRNSIRSFLIELAQLGDLAVPVAGTFPLAQATLALELLRTGHAGGNLALVP
jgi:NADPH:quinone reductase